MKKLFLLLAAVGICVVATAQNKQKAQSVIFETDMGNDIDDAMALDLLFKYADMGKINLLGVSVHKNNPHSKEYIDIMRLWYGYKKMPIGVNTACVTDMDCVDYCTKVCDLKDKNGEPLFARSKNPKRWPPAPDRGQRTAWRRCPGGWSWCPAPPPACRTGQRPAGRP